MGAAVPRPRESGQDTARNPLFPIEPPAALTPLFVPRCLSSTESLRQLSQQLNGLVSEVPQNLKPKGVDGRGGGM